MRGGTRDVAGPPVVDRLAAAAGAHQAQVALQRRRGGRYVSEKKNEAGSTEGFQVQQCRRSACSLGDQTLIGKAGVCGTPQTVRGACSRAGHESSGGGEGSVSRKAETGERGARAAQGSSGKGRVDPWKPWERAPRQALNPRLGQRAPGLGARAVARKLQRRGVLDLGARVGTRARVAFGRQQQQQRAVQVLQAGRAGESCAAAGCARPSSPACQAVPVEGRQRPPRRRLPCALLRWTCSTEPNAEAGPRCCASQGRRAHARAQSTLTRDAGRALTHATSPAPSIRQRRAPS